MSLSPRVIRSQLHMLMPLMRSCSLDTIRKAQNRVGELMEARYHSEILGKHHAFPDFEGAWIIPKDERRQGVILYLHGGGYTCGDLDYAKGFGSMLAVQTGTRVFCAAYRLAPEHPYPAALEDALTAYQYLLDKGYQPEQIALCGESAGGGLCYCLCLRLRELRLSMPCCIIAISPWTDLTSSGESYEKNKDRDPSMCVEMLEIFSRCYTDNRMNPLASPLFGDLNGMPPSLIFAAENEIMVSDAVQMHEKLFSFGCKSKLVVRQERWHGYLLYGLSEDKGDFQSINSFLRDYLCPEWKLRWLPLDNAAKIYPAARRENWSNVFRLSATLTQSVDVSVLQMALDVTVRRFPSIAARLRRGVFWYYLEQIPQVPKIREEASYPLTSMSKEEIRQCAFRVIVYHRRIAIEFFHSLTDGSGAMIFLKTLLAEYLQQKYGISIPAEEGILGRLEYPSDEELEDSFQKYAGNVNAGRRENNAWRLGGTPEPDGFHHLTCFQIPVHAVLEKAHSFNVTLTTFLGAVMMQAIQQMQKEQIPFSRLRKHIRIQLPVNLRGLYPSRTLRNFALYVTPEIDPRLGEYTFEEICAAVRHRMGLEINQKHMGSLIAANVSSERLMAVRIMPLFLKNLVMKIAFDTMGERKSCLSMSNLGKIQIPEIMVPYVERFDFILGVQATAPYNCGVLSYGDTLYVNFIRNIRESRLEYHFYKVLQDMGIPVMVESNLADR